MTSARLFALTEFAQIAEASDLRKSLVDNALTSADSPAMDRTMTLIPEAARARG